MCADFHKNNQVAFDFIQYAIITGNVNTAPAWISLLNRVIIECRMKHVNQENVYPFFEAILYLKGQFPKLFFKLRMIIWAHD